MTFDSIENNKNFKNNKIMTREEKIIRASIEYDELPVLSAAFRDGAKWADNNPLQDVVNLNEVWHDTNEEPIYGRDIIALDNDGFSLSGAFKQLENNKGVFYNYFCLCDWSVVTKWVYASDLLPKGKKS